MTARPLGRPRVYRSPPSGRVGQASDDRDRLLVALPREVDDWAAAADMNLDVCVMQSLRGARAKVDCGGAEALRLRDAPADQVERA